MLRAPLVTVEWLAQRLLVEKAATTKVLDASWHMPAQNRDPYADYLAEHIPGSQFLDIDKVATRPHAVPHMLPAPEIFRAAMEQMGISNSDTIVVYDTVGVFSAPRTWWTLRVFGQDNVAVLQGGLPAWKMAGHSTESGPPNTVPKGTFQAQYRPELVADLQKVWDNCLMPTPSFQVADARPSERWAGRVPEPRPGLAGGHIPHSVSLPWSNMIEQRPDGVKVLKDRDGLAKQFADAGIDLARPLVGSCGSGLSACVLALAAAVCDKSDVAIYDGSWTEWGMHLDTPKVKQ